MKPACAFVVFLVLAMPAFAQESGQVGLTVGAPGSIGIIWHVSDAVAIRPDFSFSHTHSESSSSVVSANAWGFGFGTSALFYTGKIRDNVRTYVTPRFSYLRTNSSSHLDADAGFVVPDAKQHQDSYQYSGAFGVQYTPTRRFSVYGEAGVVYQTANSVFTSSVVSGITTEGKTTNSNWSTRGSVGVVWYFK